MGLKLYKHKGTLYKSHNKEILARRLYGVKDSFGEVHIPSFAVVYKSIKKIKKAK